MNMSEGFSPLTSGSVGEGFESLPDATECRAGFVSASRRPVIGNFRKPDADRVDRIVRESKQYAKRWRHD
jgi:hypothetical protein